ncbi:prolipoprotein diacylglyceryl transferase [Corynebacterium ulcerans]|uniref:Phosphatidylglycerol--prolipoprotein diacylglyceryl transferase n=2 Tax=Corynebacterium ulcerans TaxID=65058 RepID=A0ABD0BNS6_CORUL|nr:diacylglyceryl transferase [Corynebacterium ulcerans]OIS08001.1 prolipoprotein diacylglyceryl transferase [Corynebacterium ulcerans]QGZ25801.1 prolipoprotein diacylglyceryl transferase [Corynebacterium ulcerans]BBJ72427.1 prolipoprotein diacylglyceryl transferase [Corynebacterium ulcerans]BBJ74732.1 prolipoprotein diacylglyceryl transferase [Corynebacterium ulcerans]
MTVSNLAYLPSPPQGIWMLAGIPIRAYALCIITGFIIAVWIGSKRYVKRGGNPDVVIDAAIVAMISGVIGGRLYHVITDHQKYFCDDCNPVDAFKITNGGLGIWGAVFLGTVCVYFYLKAKHVPFAPFADAMAPGIVLAQGIGRLGNWFNQELYGAETSVPWALEIYYRVDAEGKFAPLTGHSTGEIIATVHPTFLYELIWNVSVFLFLLWADKKFTLSHGRVFALYVAGYTLGRFFIETMRVDEATHLFGLRINVIVSAVVFIASVVVFYVLSQKARKTREEAAAVGADSQDSPIEHSS